MTVEQAVYNIRHAQYGEEVRESIAEGIETIDQDVTAQNLEAEAWAVGTRNGEPVPPTDPAYHNNAKYHAENTDVHQDGNYPEMTVGTAEQLESTVMTEDKAPYVFRTSGGSADIGNREYDTLVGGTLAWNNVANMYSSSLVTETVSGVTFTKGSGYWTVDGTAEADISKALAFASKKDGHVYFGLGLSRTGSGETFYLRDSAAGANDYGDGAVYSAGSNHTATLVMTIKSGVQITNMKVYPFLCDLTVMFGSTIANYALSLGLSNGAQWIKSCGFFDKYTVYNAGTLISVNASAHVTTGFNLWDEEWDVGSINSITGANTSGSYVRSKNYVPVIPGETYYFKRPGTTAQYRWVYAYDKNKNFLDNAFGDNYLTLTANTLNTFTVPNGVYYIRFLIDSQYGTTYKHDICINLSWSGTRNGEYEPYDAHTYSLDSDLVLRGMPKLDTSNNLYYDGDTYASDGTVTRKYGIVDLGTLTFTTYGSTSAYDRYISSSIDSIVKDDSPCICAKFITLPHGEYIAAGYIWVGGGNSKLSVTTPVGAFADAAAFKAAMSGVYLVYELATPTTEQADPFASPQIVDDWGTEEYVVTEQSGVAMPVGHVTKYPQNLRDKLQHLPNLASADGYYGIQQTGTQMVLVEPDSALSDTSKNAVQNKVVKTALALKADKTDVAAADAALEQMILASFPTDSISNVSVASFSDGADDIPVKSLTVNITPVQAGSGDPSPDNVRPISGWTGANIYDAGENLLDGISLVQGGIQGNGANNSSSARVRTDYIPISASTAYSVAIGAAGFVVLAVHYYSSNNTSSWISKDAPNEGVSSFTTPATAEYCRLNLSRTDTSANVSPSDIPDKRFLCRSSIFASVSVSWQTEAGTVYGGTLTWLGNDQWKLTVTMVAVDLSTFAWDAQPDDNRWKRHTSLNSAVAPPNNDTVANIYSDTYKVVAQSSVMTTLNTIGMSSSNNVFVNNGNFTPGNEPTGIMVYELAAPVEYTLAAESVKTLLGQNNIFADCGDINKLVYHVDPDISLATKADLNSPSFTGTPTAPTPTLGDDSTKIATTAFVNQAVFGAMEAIY